MKNFLFLPRGKCTTKEVLFLTQQHIYPSHYQTQFQFSIPRSQLASKYFVNMISFDINIDRCTCFSNGRNEIIFIDKNVSNLKYHFQLSIKLWKTIKTQAKFFCGILMPCNAMLSFIFGVTASVSIFPEISAKRLLSH